MSRPTEAGGTFFRLVAPDFAVSEPTHTPGITIVFQTKEPHEAVPHALYNGTAVELSRSEAERLWTRLGNRLGKTA